MLRKRSKRFYRKAFESAGVQESDLAHQWTSDIICPEQPLCVQEYQAPRKRRCWTGWPRKEYRDWWAFCTQNYSTWPFGREGAETGGDRGVVLESSHWTHFDQILLFLHWTRQNLHHYGICWGRQCFRKDWRVQEAKGAIRPWDYLKLDLSSHPWSNAHALKEHPSQRSEELEPLSDQRWHRQDWRFRNLKRIVSWRCLCQNGYWYTVFHGARNLEKRKVWRESWYLVDWVHPLRVGDA